MNDWKRVKIGEFAKRRKDTITIQDDIDYKLCRVQLHRKGVVLREILKGSKIKTKKQQLCRREDLVVAEMDAKFGGYGFINEDLDGAIVSSHYYLYELDHKKILRDYFTVIIQAGMIQNQIEAKGSTNYSSIRAWEFLNYTIPLPDIKTQKIVANRFLKSYEVKNELDNRGAKQLANLSDLRQRVLQGAIEGKLTAKWRQEHPDLICGDNHASKLLEKIKTEKEKLIKEGKIKKDKPLEPITEDEKPFDLPEGWMWCRLGEIAYGFDYGSSTKSQKMGKIPVLRMGNLQNGSIILEDLVYSNVDNEILKYLLKPDDLLFNRTNSRELVGKTGLYNYTQGAIFAGYLVRFHMCGKIIARFTNYLMNSVFHREWCNEVKTDALGQSNINATKLRDYCFPLPPFFEQEAIVEWVDKLMSMIDELEKQIAERKELSEKLMQAVLREAFEKDKLRLVSLGVD